MIQEEREPRYLYVSHIMKPDFSLSLRGSEATEAIQDSRSNALWIARLSADRLLPPRRDRNDKFGFILCAI